MPTPNIPTALPVGPAAAPNVLAMPNALNTTPDLMQAAGSKVGTLSNAIGNTANGLFSLLPVVGTAVVSFLALKAIVLGKNPLKS